MPTKHNMHDRTRYKEPIANTPYAEGAEPFFRVCDDFDKY